MSEAFQQPQGINRRREERLPFSNRCLASIVSPPWAITPEAILGRSENINLHGMRIGSLCHPAQPGIWQDAVRDDVELMVEVAFPERPELPPLKGRIVWVFKDQGEVDSVDSTGMQERCSIGVLFSILRESEQNALQELMQELSARS